MFEVQVLIPVVDNDGRPFTGEDHTAFEAVLVDRFGGFTLLPNEAAGKWKDATGAVYPDRTRLYAIGVGSITDGAKFADVVTFAKAHYRQLAICIRYLGIVEIL
jgi:hypothetical protein